jgi:hypothetical protein
MRRRFLYTVQALEPVRSLGEVLVEGVLQTIEKGKFVPVEVRVKQEGYRLLLLPLKERFGFELRVLENLPALEFAKEHLQRTLGDLGRI